MSETDPFSLELDEPVVNPPRPAAPVATPAVAPVVTPPDPGATAPYGLPPRPPAPVLPPPVFLPPPAPTAASIGRPVPPPAPLSAAPVAVVAPEGDDEDDDGDRERDRALFVPRAPKRSRLPAVLMLGGAALLAATAYVARDEIRSALQGSSETPTEVAPEEVPAAASSEGGEVKPEAPAVTPEPSTPAPAKVGFEKDQSGTDWSQAWSGAIEKAFTEHNAKAAITVTCKDGKVTTLKGHAVTGSDVPTIDAKTGWGVGEDGSYAQTNSYGMIQDPRKVCETAVSGVWTEYFRDRVNY